MFEGVCDPTVAGVQAADPFALAVALAAVSQEQLYRCSSDEAECVVAATQRVINAMNARQGVAIDWYTGHVIDARQADTEARAARGSRLLPGAPTPEQEAAGALAPIVRMAPRTLVSRIESARWLGLLPCTQAMAWAGDLEAHRTSVIARAAAQVGVERLSEFEARLHHDDIRDLAGCRVKTRATRIAARLLTTGESEPDTAGDLVHRTVRITPDEQPGLTRWEALLPADRSRLMWSAVEQLAHEYRTANPALSVAQSRADALTDLVLSEVQVTTTATIVLPAATALVPDQSPVDPGPDVQPSHTRPADTAPADTGPANPDSPQVDAEPTDTLPTDAAPSEPVLTSEPAGSGSRGPVAVPRVNPPPMCRCGRPLRSWADVLHPPARLTRVDLTDRHDRHHDGPVSVAGQEEPLMEWRLSVQLQDFVDVGSNPQLTQDPAGRIWFVPGVVTIPGVGTLLPAQVSAILADPDVRIRLGRANPATGAADHLDERTYRPGAALARLVRARDGTCRFPGCATASERCQLDHVVAFPKGSTTAANLQSLCRVHHGFNYHAGWSITMTPDGVCIWTAPNGRTHTTHPAAIHNEAA